MPFYDLLARHATRTAVAVAALLLAGLLLRLVALPLALAALLTGRLITATDHAAARRAAPVTSPPAGPRWQAANTRTGQTVTVY
jgi:uncharacterized membrane protein YphA (DoxX/SURF4 family)